MNWAHWHLMLNHIPVVGIGLGVVVLALGFVKKSFELQKAGLAIFVIMALLTLPAYFTGEPAEEIVEELPGFSEMLIERHEDAAKIAVMASGLLGVVALSGLALFRQATQLPRIFVIAVLLLGLAAEGALAWTANQGGKIRHAELRNMDDGSTSAESRESSLSPEEKEDQAHRNEEKHDD